MTEKRCTGAHERTTPEGETFDRIRCERLVDHVAAGDVRHWGWSYAMGDYFTWDDDGSDRGTSTPPPA